MKSIFLLACIIFFIPILLMAGARLDDEAIDNAEVANARMQQLHSAVLIYLNDNEFILDDPLRLAEGNAIPPVTFWHPGDDDPEPTLIDNSNPNHKNSAQISFLFRTGDYSALRPDELVIWDSSPANGNGQYFGMMTKDGVFETIPPAATPVPTKVALAQSHLRRLAWATRSYASENEDLFPDDLIRLYGNDLNSPRSFWNPGDSNPLPSDITNSVPDADSSTQISFDYLLAGEAEDTVPADAIAFQDNSTSNNDGIGINIARLNGVVELIVSGTVGDGNQDGCIDLADWARLQQCFSGPGTPVNDDTCRLLDFDRNGEISAIDYERFATAMIGPCP